MRYFRHISSVFVICILIACNRDKISPEEQAFMDADSTPAMIIDDREEIRYEENTYQCIFMDAPYTFCIASDDTKTYFILSCSELPDTEGQTITASLKWCVNNRIKEKRNQEFLVKKTDTKAVWLWCRSLDVGVIVPPGR